MLPLNRWVSLLADLLEQMVRGKNYSLPSNTRSRAADLPSDTWLQATDLPSNTWTNSQIEHLKAEVQRLSKENALLVERNREYFLESSLGALRERVLSSLKLGKQAAGYKTAQKAQEALYH